MKSPDKDPGTGKQNVWVPDSQKNESIPPGFEELYAYVDGQLVYNPNHQSELTDQFPTGAGLMLGDKPYSSPQDQESRFAALKEDYNRRQRVGAALKQIEESKKIPKKRGLLGLFRGKQK